MKNTNKEWITGLDSMEYDGKAYTIRTIYLKGIGMRNIAGESLKEAVYPNEEYPSAEAKAVDKAIDFYVEDKYLSCGDKQLAAYCEKEGA